jgi:hypothetical protein
MTKPTQLHTESTAGSNSLCHDKETNIHLLSPSYSFSQIFRNVANWSYHSLWCDAGNYKQCNTGAIFLWFLFVSVANQQQWIVTGDSYSLWCYDVMEQGNKCLQIIQVLNYLFRPVAEFKMTKGTLQMAKATELHPPNYFTSLYLSNTDHLHTLILE